MDIDGEEKCDLDAGERHIYTWSCLACMFAALAERDIVSRGLPPYLLDLDYESLSAEHERVGERIWLG